MKLRKITLTLAISLSSTLSLAAADPFMFPANWSTSLAGQAQRGGVYSEATEQTLSTFNPFISTDRQPISNYVSAGGLFRRNPLNNEYIPYMAQDFKISESGNEIIINLRDGMKWSDGKPISTEDWITTVKIHQDLAVKSPIRMAFIMNNVPIRVEKINELTLRFIFPTKRSNVFEILAFDPWPAHVFAPVYLSGGGEAIRAMWSLDTPLDKVVGSGPFQLNKFVPSSAITLAKNGHYGDWNQDSMGNKLPYLDGIRFDIVKTAPEVLPLYLSGQIDGITLRQVLDVDQVKRANTANLIQSQLRLNASVGRAVNFLSFNWNKSSNPEKERIFRDARFRRAIAHLIDQKSMIDLALDGLGLPATGGIHSSFVGWGEALTKPAQYSSTEAVRLLSSMGFNRRKDDGVLVDANGKPLQFDLLTNDTKQRATMAKLIAAAANEIGIDIKITLLPDAEVVKVLRSTGADRPFDALLFGFTAFSSASWPFAAAIYSCKGNLHVYNLSNTCLQPAEILIEKLYESGLQEIDINARRRIANQLQALAAQQQALIFLPSGTTHFAWSSHVFGEYPNGVANEFVGSRNLSLTWIDQGERR